MNQQTQIKSRYKVALNNASTQSTISQRDLRAIIEFQNRIVLKEMNLQLDTQGLNVMEHYSVLNN